MALPTGGLRALIRLAALPAPAAAQDRKPEQKAAAKGEVVSELGPSLMYVLQAKNNDYWFRSDDRGVYRYDGKTLVNFTTTDGLVSYRVRGSQEDKAGNVYFTTYDGICRFDGRAFTALGYTGPRSQRTADRVSATSDRNCERAG